MGLLDKLKNAFFEEEYVEVEEEEKPKKEKKKPKEKAKKVEVEEPKTDTIAKRIESPRREEVQIETLEEDDEVVVPREEEMDLSDQELLKPDSAFKQFEDDDFIEESRAVSKSVEIPVDKEEDKPKRVLYGGASLTDYHKVYRGEPREKTFHPTPIISPIYGVLDKNYSKDDIIDKKDRQKTASSYVHKVDLDTVRKKAYGDLVSDFNYEFEETESKVEVKTEEEPVDNLLYDMSEKDATPKAKNVTIADAEEYFEDLGLEYNVDYKDEAVNSSKKPRRSEKEKEESQDEPVKEEVTVPSDDTPQDDASLEDNLFDLIDSMYEDKE